MKQARFFVAAISALFVLAGSAQQSLTAPLDELVAAAKKEGVLDFYAPSTLSPEGAQKLGEAFNKKYSLSIKWWTGLPESTARSWGTSEKVNRS